MELRSASPWASPQPVHQHVTETTLEVCVAAPVAVPPLVSTPPVVVRTWVIGALPARHTLVAIEGRHGLTPVKSIDNSELEAFEVVGRRFRAWEVDYAGQLRQVEASGDREWVQEHNVFLGVERRGGAAITAPTFEEYAAWRRGSEAGRAREEYRRAQVAAAFAHTRGTNAAVGVSGSRSSHQGYGGGKGDG